MWAARRRASRRRPRRAPVARALSRGRVRCSARGGSGRPSRGGSPAPTARRGRTGRGSQGHGPAAAPLPPSLGSSSSTMTPRMSAPQATPKTAAVSAGSPAPAAREPPNSVQPLGRPAVSAAATSSTPTAVSWPPPQQVERGDDGRDQAQERDRAGERQGEQADRHAADHGQQGVAIAARRGRHASTSCAPRAPQRAAGLGLRLRPFGGRIGPPGDAAAHVQGQARAVGDEGPDEDRRAHRAVRSHPQGGARVGPATHRLQALDELHGPDLGRAGDRATGERRGQQVEWLAPGGEAARSRSTRGAGRCRSAPGGTAAARAPCPARRPAPGRCAARPRSSCSPPGPWRSPAARPRGRDPPRACGPRAGCP